MLDFETSKFWNAILNLLVKSAVRKCLTYLDYGCHTDILGEHPPPFREGIDSQNSLLEY